MSDGLTVPFALAAGISGAIAVSHLVVTAGLAEIAAGSIAMGLGGYLAGRSESEHYASERRREESEVKSVPDVEAREVEQIFEGYGLTSEESAPVVKGLRRRPQAWVDFMMRFELGLEKPDPRRALISAATIQADTIKRLVDSGVIVICAGGGGIPTVLEDRSGRRVGVEAVIDKDLSAALVAMEVQAQFLMLLTDVEVVYEGWGTPLARPIRSATPQELGALHSHRDRWRRRSRLPVGL